MAHSNKANFINTRNNYYLCKNTNPYYNVNYNESINKSKHKTQQFTKGMI